jgi:hypothetical protein
LNKKNEKPLTGKGHASIDYEYDYEHEHEHEARGRSGYRPSSLLA